MSEIFERASRVGLRFDSPKGLLTVEDLWSLPLTSTNPDKANLDDIARGLHRAIKTRSDEVSFVNPNESKTQADLVDLRFDIVKHIIGVLVAERDAANEFEKRKKTKQRILELVEQKKDQELAGKSIEELTALANSL